MAKKINLLISINVLLLILGYIVFRSYAEWNAREWMDKATASVSGAALVEVKAVNVNLLDSFITLANVDITPVREEGDSLPVRIHIDEVVLYEADRDNLPPRNLHLLINGVSVEFDPGSRPGERLKALGYEKLLGTVELDYLYDPDKGDLLIKKFSPSIDGMGTLTVKTKLSEIDLEAVLKAGLAGVMVPLQKTIMDDLEIHYEDDSLFSRLVRDGAAAGGVDETAYKKALEFEIKALVSGSGGESVRALTDFVQYPHSRRLSITALPSRVVRLGDLDIKDLYGTAHAVSAVFSSTEKKRVEAAK